MGNTGGEFLVRILRAADTFPHEVRRRPYRSQRERGIDLTEAVGISLATSISRFISLVVALEDRGYF